MDNVSGEDTISSDNTKDENEDQVENLLSKISKLENESQKFSAQRARMRDAFLLKEAEETELKKENKMLLEELNSLRSQVEQASTWNSDRLRTEEELASLTQILNDTLEESTKREDELKRCKQELSRYKSEISVLKSDIGDQRQILTTPSAMLSNIAKKVASQLGASDINSSHESLDESMRKAKADADILKALLVPLEDEIKHLTNKLSEAETDCAKYQHIIEQLRRDETMVNGLSSDININSIEELDSVRSTALLEGCDKCQKVEEQLIQSENKNMDLEKQITILERYREELAKETAVRKQMEEKWIEKKELHKTQVAELQDKLKAIEGTMKKFRQIHDKTRADLSAKYNSLEQERRETQEKLERLQKENDNLVGKHIAHSTELTNATINLPGSVQELQEMLLKQTDDLIKAKVGFERSEDSMKSLNRICSQLKLDQTDFTLQYKMLIGKKEECDKLLAKKTEDYLKVEKMLSCLKSEVDRLRSELATANEEKKQLKDSELELKNRLASMQTGLDQGEAVQKDFVLLSQSLQKELEHLRVQNNVLRWEYEEDVAECRGCEQPFKSLNKVKGNCNCKHCGRVFCLACLAHVYMSPVTRRESPVCNLCHTLLYHNTPPYFSTDLPK